MRCIYLRYSALRFCLVPRAGHRPPSSILTNTHPTEKKRSAGLDFFFFRLGGWWGASVLILLTDALTHEVVEVACFPQRDTPIRIWRFLRATAGRLTSSTRWSVPALSRAACRWWSRYSWSTLLPDWARMVPLPSWASFPVRAWWYRLWSRCRCDLRFGCAADDRSDVFSGRSCSCGTPARWTTGCGNSR